MEFVEGLGLVAMGSRFRALSERYYDLADELYRRHGLELQGRWLAVMRLLHDRGPSTVGEIAAAIGQTHSAVSQLAKKLVREGWLTTVQSTDRRQRRLDLTAKATAQMREARAIWRALQEVLAERSRAADIDPLGTLQVLGELPGKDLTDAIVDRTRQLRIEAVEIVAFRPDLREHFYRLNVEWLERYFHVEELDHRVLSDPEGNILEPGGHIFFALAGSEVVGTCALMQTEPGVFELTKMAVAPRAQGLGIGRKLIDAAIGKFQELGADTLFLESNSKLAPAIRLYESSGFVHQPALKPDSHYQRANVYMVWHPAA